MHNRPAAFRVVVLSLAMVFALFAGGCGAARGTEQRTSSQDAAVTPPAGTAQPEQPGRYIERIFPDVDVTQNIQYGSAVNADGVEEKLLLDIYQPAGDKLERRPAVIFVHGGGFTGGDKAGGIEAELARILAQKGYVTLSINYRLRKTPSADWVGSFRDAGNDAYAAFAWLVGHKDEYRVDAGHIAFGGHSAGSNIVTDLCYSDWSARTVAKDGVFAVISMAGPETIFARPTADDPFDIIIHGEQDELVPVSGSESLARRLDAIGTPHLLDIIPMCYHDQSPAINEVEDVVTSCLYQAMTGKDAGVAIRRYSDEIKQLVPNRLAQRPMFTVGSVSGIALDGRLDEWTGVQKLPLDQLKDAGSSLPAPQDCAAEGMMAWDPSKPSCLYAAMTVTDDVFQEHENASFWENDCMELLVDVSDKDKTLAFMQWVANIDGKELNYTHCNAGSCQVAVSRQGDTVTFEIMVDLTKAVPELSGYSLAGRTIGFCLCYDDGDAGARQHQVGLVAGRTLDPKNFANLRIAGS